MKNLCKECETAIRRLKPGDQLRCEHKHVTISANDDGLVIYRFTEGYQPRETFNLGPSVTYH